MKRNVISGACAAGMALMLAVPAVAGQSYILLSNGPTPKNLKQEVTRAGGKLTRAYSFGVAVASSDSADFANNLPAGIKAIADVGFDVEYPDLVVEFQADAGFPPNSGDDDAFFDLQWGHNYVGAQNAWNNGITGAGVRVAVLDGGFDLDHPDLAPNINLGLSMDFTGEGLQYTFADTFSHGSHTAGTVAAADNGFGTIGVAPGAELVLVKVLGDAGSGSFANVIAGIVHAANVDADVISMSLGTMIPRQEEGVTQLAIALSQAVKYASQMGSTVIVSAGNDAWNQDGDGSMVRFNDVAEDTIPISALTTLNWAANPDQDLVPASYTNYGVSGVDFGAPGGSGDYPGNEGCVVAGLARPCWVFDLVFSTGNGGWYWSAGTSMAAPHAAGVAALIIEELGGDVHPAQVKAEMRKRALDGGKPGRDDFFGHGIANSGH